MALAKLDIWRPCSSARARCHSSNATIFPDKWPCIARHSPKLITGCVVCSQKIRLYMRRGSVHYFHRTLFFISVIHRILSLPGEESGHWNMLIHAICMYEQCNQVSILRASAVPMIHLAHITNILWQILSSKLQALRTSSFYMCHLATSTCHFFWSAFDLQMLWIFDPLSVYLASFLLLQHNRA